jgi:hypothetical protein
MMKLRGIVTVVLLLFVGASVAYLAWDASRDREGSTPQVVEATGGDHTLVVYYFHGTKRCRTCRTIEAFTKEAVESAFASELEAGEVEIRTVNVEAAGNEHFVDDYELATRSVVLVDMVAGEEKRWQRLDEVWSLVGDRASFIDYIVDNATDFVRKEG